MQVSFVNSFYALAFSKKTVLQKLHRHMTHKKKNFATLVFFMLCVCLFILPCLRSCNALYSVFGGYAPPNPCDLSTLHINVLYGILRCFTAVQGKEQHSLITCFTAQPFFFFFAKMFKTRYNAQSRPKATKERVLTVQ